MKKLTNKSNNMQAGFTLIELVVVIVILGILAATAAPKFINLQDDARTATLQAVKASMQSAATLVHSKSLIQGNETAAKAAVNVNGSESRIAFGYPASVDDSPVTGPPALVAVDAATLWGSLLDIVAEDFTIIKLPTSSPTSIAIYPTGTTAPTTLASPCIAYYTAATLGNSPTFGLNECL